MRTNSMRKCRTGIWHSQGQGSGYTAPAIKDDAANDADVDDDPDDDLSPEDMLKKANDEAKRRRLQVKELRRENERLKAERAVNGATGDDSGPDRSEVILSLVEDGLSRDRIRAAMRLIDWSSVDNVEDAIDDLRDEHPFLFEAAKPEQQDQDLPGTGSRHNGNKNRSKAATNAQLAEKYSALRYARGRS